MAQPYIGEIRMFGGNFPPVGWLFCDGQQLPISENEALFQLIGTTYGGDGQETFNLPNLQSRVPIHQGQGPGLPSNRVLAETGGAEEITLTTQQIPVHNHAYLGAQVPGDQITAAQNLTANSLNVTPYINQAPDGPMAPQAITPIGGSQPHTNIQPYLCITFIISLFGIFPSPT
jgi:microcystin-dependent protein